MSTVKVRYEIDHVPSMNFSHVNLRRIDTGEIIWQEIFDTLYQAETYCKRSSQHSHSFWNDGRKSIFFMPEEVELD